VIAACVDCREGRTSVFLVLAVEVEVHAWIERLAYDRLSWCPCRRETSGTNMTIGPLGVKLVPVFSHTGGFAGLSPVNGFRGRPLIDRAPLPRGFAGDKKGRALRS
jgi:hypothetical protein